VKQDPQQGEAVAIQTGDLAQGECEANEARERVCVPGHTVAMAAEQAGRM